MPLLPNCSRSIRFALCAISLAFISLISFADDGKPISKPDDEGFISLFNGQDLTGWEGLPNYWSVKDGTITGFEKKDESKQTFLVCTVVPSVSNFELHYKFRFATLDGNSGVQFRSKVLDAESFRVGGYQADCDAQNTYTGIIYDEAGVAGGRGIMSNRGEATRWDADNQRHSQKLDKDSDEQKKSIKVGDWNDCVLIANGNRITYSINGNTTTELIDESSKALRDGVIALQLHAGFTMEIQFKDLKLKMLDETDSTAHENVIRIWPGAAPGSESWAQKEIEQQNQSNKTIRIRNVTTPTLTVFSPDPAKATGAAVIVCPGGGFHMLSWQSEGTEVAEWLQQRGVAAFVLKYRLVETPVSEEEFAKEMTAFIGRITKSREALGEPQKSGEATRPAVPEELREISALGIADGRQAIKVVRQHAAEWGIKPDRIGIMGFSAGGMVTMGVVMEHDEESRPDFAAPIYGGSTGGVKIPADAPPLFVLCASDDQFAASESIRLYSDWKAAGRAAELHIYEKGGHGFGMTPKGLPVDGWIERYGDWLSQRDLLNAIHK